MTMRAHLSLLCALVLACGGGDGEVTGTDAGTTTGTGTTAGSSGDETTDATTSTSDATETTATTTGEPAPLEVDPGEPRYALVGDEVVLDGSGSKGASEYQWYLDDGTPQPDPSAAPTAAVTYAAPGRYKPILTVYDGMGGKLSASVTITVTHPPTWSPRQSSTVAWLGEGRVAVVSPDSDEVMIAGGDARGYAVLGRLPTAAGPSTLAPVDGGWIAIAARDAAAIELLLPDPSGAAIAQQHLVALPRGARPRGVVAAGGTIYATLQGTGQLAEIAFTGDGPPTLVDLHDVIADARGVAILPDGQVAVTRWRSDISEEGGEGEVVITGAGEVAIFDPRSAQLSTWTLQLDPQNSSDTEIGGVPSYLDQIAVSPIGDLAALPSLQANVGEGAFKNGKPLQHDTTLRAISSFIELPSGVERFDLRHQFDNRGLASAAAFSTRGDYLYVATRGSRSIERLDILEDAQAGSVVDIGYAPQGLAVSDDDRLVFVDVSLSRELVVLDVSTFDTPIDAVARLQIPSSEPLAPTLLRGKQLFNDSLDPRLSKDGYMACAHCHLEGDADHLVWDFTDRGEGLRSTISMLGRAGAGDGPIHWSANFDEIQDFENDIRGPFGGFGLLDDADWESGTHAQTLGDPKAGLSDDLDALAAYVTSLAKEPDSPHRQPDGALTPAAAAG
ncbi:MAG: hypothetical protein KC636_15690, partial [Myxococcales bacterium]|nr:hypothetical protein [Myxococcales bacterium]